MLLVSCSMRMSRVYATAAITIISARMTAKLTTILRRIVRFFIVSITLEPVTARRRKAPERSRGVENGCSRSQIVSSHCTGSAKKRLYWIAQRAGVLNWTACFRLDGS